MVLILIARLVAIDNLEAFVIVCPALAGGVLALIRPASRSALVLATVLIASAAGISLIGGVGSLFLPSIALLIAAALRAPSDVSRSFA
ncbi:MAG: hypothetical protein WD186_04330 [Actinomycetota bacterium]